MIASFKWKISGLIGCIVVLAIFIYWYSGGFRMETTPGQAARKFEMVGGVEKVNQEECGNQ